MAENGYQVPKQSSGEFPFGYKVDSPRRLGHIKSVPRAVDQPGKEENIGQVLPPPDLTAFTDDEKKVLFQKFGIEFK